MDLVASSTSFLYVDVFALFLSQGSLQQFLFLMPDHQFAVISSVGIIDSTQYTLFSSSIIVFFLRFLNSGNLFFLYCPHPITYPLSCSDIAACWRLSFLTYFFHLVPLLVVYCWYIITASILIQAYLLGNLISTLRSWLF